MVEPFNLPFIKERVDQTHKQFLQKVGIMPDKINADHQFLTQRMATRIESVLKCFRESGVIDFYAHKCENLDGDQNCYLFELFKNGFSKKVYISTDGENIVIRAAKYSSRSGLNLKEDEIIRDVDFENYNWIEFVDKLLHFIHQEIYESKKSIETNVFGAD